MKKVLIILGAGSSIPVGMPSVSDLDRKMFDWSDDWSPAPGVENYYRAVWKGVEQYYFASPDSIKPSPNFEKVLGEMVGLAHWMTPPPFGNALRQLISPTSAPIGMTFHKGRYAATVGINDQLTHQLVKLAQHMRELCKDGAITRHSKFSETGEYIRWLGEDIALFQQERPDLPQGRNLNAKTRRKLLTAWNKAREAAELEDAGRVSPEWQETVRRFHRTRTLTFPSSSRKAVRKTKK